MPIVTYDGHEFECATALKGADYIKLVDANDCVIASFEGVIDFSLFTISDGSFVEDISYHYPTKEKLLVERYPESVSMQKTYETVHTDMSGNTYYTYGEATLCSAMTEYILKHVRPWSNDYRLHVSRIDPHEDAYHSTSATTVDEFIGSYRFDSEYRYCLEHYVFTHIEIDYNAHSIKLIPVFDEQVPHSDRFYMYLILDMFKYQ